MEDKLGIFVSRFAHYDVVDYHYVVDETFENSFRVECRGLKFSKDGKLLARPFHKFFNLRERQAIHDITHAELLDLAVSYDVSLVSATERPASLAQFVEDAREYEDIEGYVIAFDEGHRLKLKTDYYALRHKAVSALSQEKNVLAMVARNGVDDVIPLLAPEAADRLRAYERQLAAAMRRHLQKLSAFVTENSSLERAEFARAVKSQIDKRLQNVAFDLRDGKGGYEALQTMLSRASRSESRLDTIRDLYEMTWEFDGIDIDAG